MRGLCRGWATQAFYQLRLAGTVLQWRPHAGRRHPDLMSFLEKVKENWRRLLGKLISCINGLVEPFSLNYCMLRVTGLANAGLPETWRELRRRSFHLLSSCCAFWDCWEGDSVPQPTLVYLVKGICWCWGGHCRGLQGGMKQWDNPQGGGEWTIGGDLFLVVDESGVM